MTMKLEITDSQSNHSDFSSDSQSSQGSSNNDAPQVPSTRPSLMLASFEGLNSGVPTRTTATITPTQLRSFEQTCIELGNYQESANHAGFVPPRVANSSGYGMLNQMSYAELGPTSALHVSPGPLSASGDSMSSPGLPQPKRRNMGGRRPTKPAHNTTPEEEERRKQRRERNKQAAARCRKRRLDQTNQLQDETDKLESKRHDLQEEVRRLREQSDELQMFLHNHLASCPLMANRPGSPPDVKPFHQDMYGYPEPEDGVRVKVEVMEPPCEPLNVGPVINLDNDHFVSPTTDKRIMLSAANPAVVTTTSSDSLQTPPATTRLNRPNFLHVPLQLNPAQMHNNKALGANKIAGVEITTPSNGIPFNFESLMEGGTGLTPVHPHHPHLCSTQQQRSAPDVSSPDSHGNPNLVSL